MKLYCILLAVASVLISTHANAKLNQEVPQEDTVITVSDQDVIDQNVSEEAVSEEITILDSEEEYSQWLEEQEGQNSETVYIDEEGNEYYIVEEDVAGKSKPRLKKKKGPKALRRNCSAKSGKASWYGPGFHGRTTANGEKYNQNAYTAAHKTLKFGTIVRVTYKGKSVDVRINDAGPYSGGRVIDISKAAAKKIGLIGPGVGSVTLKVISCG